MAVSVQSHSLPQPLQLTSIPVNSTGAKPGPSDPRPVGTQAVEAAQPQSAYARFHPQGVRRVKVAADVPGFSLMLRRYGPGVAGLATMGVAGAGLSFLRRKRREQIRRERDRQWKSDIGRSFLNGAMLQQ